MVEYKIAKVIDNNDPKKSGRVQIRIQSEMDKVPSNILPWVMPFTINSGGENIVSSVPEIGTYIYVFFMDNTYFRNGYYVSDVVFEELSKHNQVIGSMSGSYPDIKFIKLKNGVSIAINSNETEATIKAGNAEIYIDPNGKIKIANSSESLKTLFEDLIDEIINIKTFGSPTFHQMDNSSITNFTTLKTRFLSLFED